MGHTHSKHKKRGKKIHDMSGSRHSMNIQPNLVVSEPRDIVQVISVKDNNRLSVDSLDRVSFTSAFSRSPDSGVVMESPVAMEPRCTLSLSRNNNISKEIESIKEAFSCEKLTMDEHPTMTKLQNDQNRRLEKMEERMQQIRVHAMQEVERRKFAHMFKAKKHSPTREVLGHVQQQLAQEANNCHRKNALNIIQDIKPRENLDSETDTGEIIPMTILHDPSPAVPENTDNDADPKPQPYLQNLPGLGAVNTNPGVDGQMPMEWWSEAFRQKVIKQNDDAVRQAATPKHKLSTNMENHVFNKAKTRDEYMALVARLILYIKGINPVSASDEKENIHQQTYGNYQSSYKKSFVSRSENRRQKRTGRNSAGSKVRRGGSSDAICRLRRLRQFPQENIDLLQAKLELEKEVLGMKKEKLELELKYLNVKLNIKRQMLDFRSDSDAEL